VINLKINMLEVKKDRLIEINIQIKKAFRTKYAINLKNLYDEKRDLIIQIQLMEVNRGRK
jgi:hypothetical protein